MCGCHNIIITFHACIYIYIYIICIHRLKFWMWNTLNQQMNLGARNVIQPVHPSSHLGPRHAGWCWRHFDLDSFKTFFHVFSDPKMWPLAYANPLINLNPATEEQWRTNSFVDLWLSDIGICHPSGRSIASAAPAGISVATKLRHRHSSTCNPLRDPTVKPSISSILKVHSDHFTWPSHGLRWNQRFAMVCQLFHKLETS